MIPLLTMRGLALSQLLTGSFKGFREVYVYLRAYLSVGPCNWSHSTFDCEPPCRSWKLSPTCLSARCLKATESVVNHLTGRRQRELPGTLSTRLHLPILPAGTTAFSYMGASYSQQPASQGQEYTHASLGPAERHLSHGKLEIPCYLQS